MTTKGKLKQPRDTTVVSFRMDKKAAALMNERAEDAGITPRTWVEQTVLGFADTHVVARRKEHPDLRALLFQVSRAGNNINQLAHKFNALDAAGRLDRHHFASAVESLNGISDLLRKALNRAG